MIWSNLDLLKYFFKIHETLYLFPSGNRFSYITQLPCDQSSLETIIMMVWVFRSLDIFSIDLQTLWLHFFFPELLLLAPCACTADHFEPNLMIFSKAPHRPTVLFFCLKFEKYLLKIGMSQLIWVCFPSSLGDKKISLLASKPLWHLGLM